MDKEELINDYFEASLKTEDKKIFDRLLKDDDDFKADFEFQKKLKNALKKDKRQNIKQMFSNLNEDKKEKPSKVIQLRILIAAAAIVIIAGLSFLFLTNNAVDSQKLYAQYFEPYENVVHPIERGNTIDDIKTEAFIAYEEGDYELSLNLFEKLKNKQNDSYINFYNGIILMQLNRHEEAIFLLNDYINSGNLEFKDRALWYLSLSYLKTNDINESKKALKSLINLNSYKTIAAKDLLDKIN